MTHDQHKRRKLPPHISSDQENNGTEFRTRRIYGTSRKSKYKENSDSLLSLIAGYSIPFCVLLLLTAHIGTAIAHQANADIGGAGGRYTPITSPVAPGGAEVKDTARTQPSSPRAAEAVSTVHKGSVGRANSSGKPDINRLAKAVAHAETAGCTLGYGAQYNNCMGIKKGSIAPCAKTGKNHMCVYTKQEESYEAFKKIWSSPRGYDGRFPTMADAKAWSGGDNSDTWLKNVTTKYAELTSS